VALSCALARRLIALGERLIVLEKLGTRADAFLRLLDRPVRGSVHATIG
jgi:hypothetical protein